MARWVQASDLVSLSRSRAGGGGAAHGCRHECHACPWCPREGCTSESLARAMSRPCSCQPTCATLMAMGTRMGTATRAGCLQQDPAVPPPRGCAASPVFTWHRLAAGTSPGSTRHSRSPGPLPPQHTLLPAAGTAQHSGASVCVPPKGTSTCKLSLGQAGLCRCGQRLQPAWDTAVPSRGMAEPCLPGVQGRRGQPQGQPSHLKNKAQRLCPHPALSGDTRAAGGSLSHAQPLRKARIPPAAVSAGRRAGTGPAPTGNALCARRGTGPPNSAAFVPRR